MAETFVHARCPECGGQLKFIEGKRKLGCRDCKYTRLLSNQYGNIVSKKSLKDRVNLKEFERGFFKPLTEYQCGKCKAHHVLPPDSKMSHCPFCASADFKPGERQNKVLRPIHIIPPVIPLKLAQGKLLRYIRRGILRVFYAPGIEKVLEPGAMRGVYLPGFLFDAYTRTKWRGEAGFKYTYQVPAPAPAGGGGNKGGKPPAGGKPQGGGTKQQSGIVWDTLDGYFEQLYDDLIVMGSEAGDGGTIGSIPFDPSDAIPFDDRYMGEGWSAELYAKDEMRFFDEVETQIESDLKAQAEKKLKAGTKRDSRKLEYISEKNCLTFRYIWLPVWMASFQYQGKHFQFMVNAQTGKIAGKRPLSTPRIIVAVVAMVLLLLLIAFLTS